MIKRFNRFELKYIITAGQRDVLIGEIERQMKPDLAASPDGAYQVTSLYYDTHDLAFVRNKIEGIKFRRKIRIRRYGEFDANGMVTVEIKQRINRTTQKRRLPLPLDAAYRLCAGSLTDVPESSPDRAAAEEVVYMTRALDLGPSCIVGYGRRAFVGGRYETGLRITFDQTLWASPTDGGLECDRGRYALLPLDRVVMEVKANNAVPLWVANMLARHTIPLTRYSKYCAGVLRLRAQGVLVSTAIDPGSTAGPPSFCDRSVI